MTALERRVYEAVMIYRRNQYDIAGELGVSQQRVSQLLAQARSKMPRSDAAELRQSVLDLHEHLIRKALSLAEMRPAPVTVGKDGDVLLDPEDGKVVRDHSLSIAAHHLLLKTLAEVRKMEGLDAATRVDVQAQVRYVIEGVDVEALK